MGIGKNPLSAKGITDEITDNHPVYIYSGVSETYQNLPKPLVRGV